MIFLLCLAAFVGLLVTGALIDIECRRLPNWLTGAVAALYGLYVLTSPQPVDWLGASMVAGVVFALGFAAFAFQVMGGGDVKLMAALSLWAGVDHIALFLIVTALAGGVLAFVMLLASRCLKSPGVSAALAMFADLRMPNLFTPASALSADGDQPLSLPYGVAIAAGGFAVLYALLQH